MEIRVFYYKGEIIAKIQKENLLNNPNVLCGITWDYFKDTELDSL